MDRFIDLGQIHLDGTNYSLKSNMDRFIGVIIIVNMLLI